MTAVDWQTRDAASRRARRWAWIGPILAMVAGSAVTSLSRHAPGVEAPVLAAGIALLAVGILWGTAIYMRVIDEQERQANLWSGYAGFLTFVVLFLIRCQVIALHRPPPFTDTAALFAAMTVALATFAWKRFR